MIRIGQGYDVHRFSENRQLILGGVVIPHPVGLLGHSDADVLLHALMDAMLGALALGDIGQHFPDTDMKYKGADSLELLEQVAKLIRFKGYELVNCDAAVILQSPKIAAYIPSMRKNIARACNVPQDRISVKATTEEHMGFTGRGEGAAAMAVVLVSGE